MWLCDADFIKMLLHMIELYESSEKNVQRDDTRLNVHPKNARTQITVDRACSPPS